MKSWMSTFHNVFFFSPFNLLFLFFYFIIIFILANSWSCLLNAPHFPKAAGNDSGVHRADRAWLWLGSGRRLWLRLGAAPSPLPAQAGLAPLQGRNPFLEQVKTTLAPQEVQGAFAPASRPRILEPHCPGLQLASGQEECQIFSGRFTVFPKRRSLKWEAPSAQAWWTKMLWFCLNFK